MDETGFVMGMGGNQRVVTSDPADIPPAPSTSNRETITVTEAVNGKGDSIAPFIIFHGRQQSASLFENYLPAQTKIVANEESYCTNDFISQQWLEHFETLSRLKQVGEYRLLLLDGHESHGTFEFIQYCWDHKIVPFRLPPHSTHLTQPLDLTVFGPMKHYHRLAVDHAARISGSINFS